MINDETTVKNVTCTSKNDVARVEGGVADWAKGAGSQGNRRGGKFLFGGRVCLSSLLQKNKAKQNGMPVFRSLVCVSVLVCVCVCVSVCVEIVISLTSR